MTDSGGRISVDYTTDAYGNLSTIAQDGVNYSFTYDHQNRRTATKVGTQTLASYSYNSRNLLSTTQYGNGTNHTLTYDESDRLIGEAITYDAIGNPLTYRGYTLTWQKGRQLKSIENSRYDLDFKYNADGLRTEKKVNGITYSYIWSSGLLMQLSGNGHTLKFGYSPDGRVLSVNYNGSDYYYVYNLQGDVIALYNTAGNVVVEYTYDSWGRILSTTGSQANGIGLTNPFRYRGYLYDGETGLYYLRSRYYDPEVGRFINADGYVSTGTGLGGYNMFAYCNNNPVMYVDSAGTRPIASTTVANETKEERKISCDFTHEQIANENCNKVKMLLGKTTISLENEIVIRLPLDKNTYVNYLNNNDVARGYSNALYQIIEKYSANYSIMSEDHIYSELLAHYYIYNIFEAIPITKELIPSIFNSVKTADLNYSENRLRKVMDIILWLEK